MAALATINIGMTLGARQGVHPFFERNRCPVKSSNASRQASSTCERPAVSCEDGKTPSAPTTVASMSLQIVSAKSPSDPVTHSNNESLENSSPPTTQQDGHGFVSENNHKRLSSEGNAKQTEQSVQVNRAEVASLDVDLNSSRNKRRKLSLPKVPDVASEDYLTAWFVQLQEAAYGQAGPTTSAQSSLTDDCPIAKMETQHLPLSAQDPKTHGVEEQGAVTDVSTPNTGSLEVPSAQRSPSRKKMLGLRANGRLSSPKSRNRLGGNSKDTKSKGKLKPSGYHKVVVIQYGTHGESGNEIGQKIHAILGGDVKGQGLVAERPIVPSQLAKTAPPGPPKPTHPFFLGIAPLKQASGVKALIESRGTSIGTAGSDSEHDLRVSPRKPRPAIENKRQADISPRLAGPKIDTVSQGMAGAFRNPGGVEPAWPSKDAMHIRGLEGSRNDASIRQKTQIKLKGSMVRVPRDEDVVLLSASQLPIGERRDMAGRSNAPYVLRMPQREVMTGTQLQALSCLEVSTRLHASHHARAVDFRQRADLRSNNTHPAVSRLFLEIPPSLTAFDRAQCEPYAWVQKYAPNRAEEVLQPGREALLLRDWLRNLTVESTDSTRADGQPFRAPSASTKRPIRDYSGPQTARRRKRHKRIELLDGFVVSSDDESNEMDELTGPEDEEDDLVRSSGYTQKRTVVRTGDIRDSFKLPGAASRPSNAVLISGPHGCGKTAAVYAAAKELGFEIFELNPGSKRSGKDIMDKVGDMAQNHLVHHASERDEGHEGGFTDTDKTSNRGNLAQGRPITKLFAKLKGKAKTKALATHGDLKPGLTPDTKPKQQAKPKQSLILLEEVDILFDEDKQFWATVLGLIAQSKRPVIMTCNDESLVPLNQMSLHAIFRFVQPACDPAADYLLLLAASEGHLLGRSAVLALYRSKDLDLRASIMEMEFWCQMAIGDKKGGLEWMLEHWPAANDLGDPDRRLRVVSKDTYLKGMGWFNRDNACEQERPSKERTVELLLQAWQNWGIGTEDLARCEDMNVCSTEHPADMDGLQKAPSRALRDYDTYADAASATDLFGSPGLRTGNQALLDPTQPGISEKVRGSFVEGYTFIQSDILVEHGELSTVLATYIQGLARCALSTASSPMRDTSIMEDRLISYVADGKASDHASRSLTRMDLAAAFDTLAEPAKRNLNQPAGLLLSDFDRSTSLLVEDLAPYVRSIIAYDLRLEEERLRLSNLLSQRGRDGKRIRTTRASRAALEGGSKAHTRRERWLPTGTNAALVLRTGGQGWQDVVAEYRLHGAGDGDDEDAGTKSEVSRRSSLDNTSAGSI